MPPLSPLVAVIAAASASASFTATPAAMSLRGRACISEAPVKGALERQISSAEAALQRRGAVLDHAHGNRAAADGNRPRQIRVHMASSDQWMEKGAARERRISYLKNKGDLNASESGELDGLISRGLQFEEQYNTRTFSAEHVAFKASHNAALAALAAHCSQAERPRDHPPCCSGYSSDRLACSPCPNSASYHRLGAGYGGLVDAGEGAEGMVPHVHTHDEHGLNVRYR